VLGLFERRVVRPGDIVVRQGEAGDAFYVVDEGAFDVYLLQHAGAQPEHVHTYTSQPGQVASFGELALLYSKQRAAMVVARAVGSLWVLHRQPFRAALQVCKIGVHRASGSIERLNPNPCPWVYGTGVEPRESMARGWNLGNLCVNMHPRRSGL